MAHLELVNGLQTVGFRSYESTSLDHMVLDPEEQLRLKRASYEAHNNSAVGNLRDYLVDVGDWFTIEHQDRVGEINGAIAVRLGCSHEIVRDAVILGAVHDMGKWPLQHLIHIDGPLTDQQYEETKPHSSMGAGMVAAAGLGRGVTHGTGNHHGYQKNAYCTFPAALYDRTKEGPLSPDHIIGTGLVAADVHDAMTSARPGRPEPLPLQAALDAVGEMPLPTDVKLAYRSLFNEAVMLDQAA